MYCKDKTFEGGIHLGVRAKFANEEIWLGFNLGVCSDIEYCIVCTVTGLSI